MWNFYLKGKTLKAQKPIETEKDFILFAETGVSVENVYLSSRQACSIESAALTNPKSDVILFYVNQERFDMLEETAIIRALNHYKNIKIDTININELSVGTPMESFVKSGLLSTSKFIVEHTSDVVRLLLLWKFSGTYIDTDMIYRNLLKTFPTISLVDKMKKKLMAQY